MNQGKLEVVKQEMTRVNADILGIRELRWTRMGEFKSDDHYIYYCGQEVDGETVEAVSDFIFLGSKITADGNCSHEIKRQVSWKKTYDPPRQHIKKQRRYFANKGPSMESRLPEEISITSDMQMTPPLWQKVKRN